MLELRVEKSMSEFFLRCFVNDNKIKPKHFKGITYNESEKTWYLHYYAKVKKR